MLISIFATTLIVVFPVVLVQMRFELCPLRSHLFIYNLIDNPFCPACGNSIETTEHYFFECIHYAAPRQSLLNDIAGLDESLLTQSEIKNVILFGSLNKNYGQRIQINKLLFRYTATFLYTTERFRPNLQIWNTFPNFFYVWSSFGSLVNFCSSSLSNGFCHNSFFV